MNEKVEMWVSRYALNGGVQKATGELAKDKRYFLALPSFTCYKIGRDAHPTEAEAKAAAESMRVKKIASLQKQIARLEKLTF